PTRYTATAKVMVADRSPTGPDLTAAAQGMPPDLAFMTSQVQVIASRNLAATVIDKLGLESDPEFNQELRPKTLLRQLLDWLPIESVRRDLGLEPPVAEGDSPLPPS
ncbi:MAG TPA: hypothetical protein VES39_12200, partial [Rhodospirillales bacterium]|nr:hypothetical protein [Rhodospirillales bacterium]